MQQPRAGTACAYAHTDHQKCHDVELVCAAHVDPWLSIYASTGGRPDNAETLAEASPTHSALPLQLHHARSTPQLFGLQQSADLQL